MDLVQKYFSLVVWNKVDVESDSLESAIFYISHRCKLFMNNQNENMCDFVSCEAHRRITDTSPSKLICKKWWWVISNLGKSEHEKSRRAYKNCFATFIFLKTKKKKDVWFWTAWRASMNKRYEHILNPWMNSSHFQKV